MVRLAIFLLLATALSAQTARRLTRYEYNATIRDLLAVPFNPAADFPIDDSGYGFDNIADVLSVSPALMEKYFAAAEKIAEAAIIPPTPQPPSVERYAATDFHFKVDFEGDYDVLIAINGKPVSGQDFNEAINTMRGPVGSRVTLTVERQHEKKPFDVTLLRADVPYDATTSRREGDVGYIRMPGFNEKTAEGLEKAVRDLKKQIGPGIKGYVLDLRNNPGGLLDQAIQVSDDFLNSGEIVSTRGRRPEDTQRFDAKAGKMRLGLFQIQRLARGNHDPCPLLTQRLGDLQPKAAGAACNDRHFSG